MMPMAAASSVKAARASCTALEAALRRAAARRLGEVSLAMHPFVADRESRRNVDGRRVSRLSEGWLHSCARTRVGLFSERPLKVACRPDLVFDLATTTSLQPTS